MKVFISSVISEMEAFRDAAARAARVLGHEVIRAEDFGARPDSPQAACLCAPIQGPVSMPIDSSSRKRALKLSM